MNYDESLIQVLVTILIVVDFVGGPEEFCVIVRPLLHVDNERAVRVHQVLLQHLQVTDGFLNKTMKIKKWLTRNYRFKLTQIKMNTKNTNYMYIKIYYAVYCNAFSSGRLNVKVLKD